MKASSGRVTRKRPVKRSTAKRTVKKKKTSSGKVIVVVVLVVVAVVGVALLARSLSGGGGGGASSGGGGGFLSGLGGGSSSGGAGIGGKPTPLPERATYNQALAKFEQYAAYVTNHPPRGETAEETKAELDNLRWIINGNRIAWSTSGSACIGMINQRIYDLD